MCDRLAAQLDDPDPAGRKFLSVTPHNPALESLDEVPERGEPTGIRMTRRHRDPARFEQVGVDDVEHLTSTRSGTDTASVVSAIPYTGARALGSSPNRVPACANASMVSGSTGSAPFHIHLTDDRSTAPSSACASLRASNEYAKFGAAVTVPRYLVMSSAHNIGDRRKSSGVTDTTSPPICIGTLRNPTIPMSWNSGSQLIMTSSSSENLMRSNIAYALT